MVDRPRDFSQARKAMTARTPVDPERFADPDDAGQDRRHRSMSRAAAVVAGWPVSTHASLDTPVTPDVDVLVGDWLTLPDLAEALDLDVVRVRQLIKDGVVVACVVATEPSSRCPLPSSPTASSSRSSPGC